MKVHLRVLRHAKPYQATVSNGALQLPVGTPGPLCGEARWERMSENHDEVDCRRCRKHIDAGRRLFSALYQVGRREKEHERGRAVAADIDWYGGA